MPRSVVFVSSVKNDNPVIDKLTKYFFQPFSKNGHFTFSGIK